jgi:RsiW-degrading membrane proteinase PrsW (M82 family)
MGLFLSFILSFIPALLFAWIIYWLDRYEKEPKVLLGGVFLWGAAIAAGAAFVINTLLGEGIYLFTSSKTATELATGSLIAPMVEETLKGLAVLVIFLFVHQEFDSILDGIVYAAIAALGFAATENAFYLYEYGYLPNGFAGLIWMFFVRIFLVGWQHPFYTAFIGIGLAVVRLKKDPPVRVVALLGGLTLAILLHSAHNTIGNLLDNSSGLVVGALFDWSGWTLMFLFILWATGRERNWIIGQLTEEVKLGSLTPAQYHTACSAWSQSRARFNGLVHGRLRTTSRFYQVCGELAYKKHQLATLGEEGGNSQVIERLRLELHRLSPLAVA